MNDLMSPMVTRKEAWLDQSLYAKGGGLRSLVESSMILLYNHPAERRRKRKRKEEDKKAFEACIEVVICNLAYVTLRPTETRRIVCSLDRGRKVLRYDNPLVYPKTLLTVIDRLEGVGIKVEVGRWGTDTSTIAPNDWFMRRILEAGVILADFGRDPNQEVIILNKTSKSFGHSQEGIWGPQRNASRIDYDDTPETHALRAEVRAVNAFLEGADIVFKDDGLSPSVDHLLDRRLSRYFTTPSTAPRFDLGGRLFGAFWLNLKKARRSNIRINGEPIADLDFRNMFARLAYARVGQEPPEGDLYDLTGLLDGYDGTNGNHRDGVKRAFNSLLNGGKAGSKDLYADLPDGATPKKVRKAIAAKHPALAPVLGTPVGLELMRTESDVLLRVLETLKDQGIVALPMHDGLMVARSHTEAARRTMEAVAEAWLGTLVPVTIKAF